ncbi:MAG: PulJ/GspJ family protein [Maricaulaceae bacterium]
MRGKDSGFSLLETLFALAIMSLASLALFQSTSSMLKLSDRAVQAGERVLEGTLNRKALTNLIDAILPIWPEEEQGEFKGRHNYLEGLSSDALNAQGQKPTLFRLSLKKQGFGFNSSSLIYHLIADAKIENKDEEWVLFSNIPSTAKFSYMGIDHTWYETWPPEPLPVSGYFNDHLFAEPAPLPEVIKLEADGKILWIGRISRYRALPLRFEFGRDNL